MDLLAVLGLVTAFPTTCLVFVLWMARLEESLPRAVAAARRRPDPPPIVEVPVRPGPGQGGSEGEQPARSAA